MITYDELGRNEVVVMVLFQNLHGMTGKVQRTWVRISSALNEAREALLECQAC